MSEFTIFAVNGEEIVARSGGVFLLAVRIWLIFRRLGRFWRERLFRLVFEDSGQQQRERREAFGCVDAAAPGQEDQAGNACQTGPNSKSSTHLRQHIVRIKHVGNC